MKVHHRGGPEQGFIRRECMVTGVLLSGCAFGVMKIGMPNMIYWRPPTSYGRFRQGLNAACRRYLVFAPEYRYLEKRIAWEVVRMATDPQYDGVGHDCTCSLNEMAVLATRAYIRHRYTDYDRRKKVVSKISNHRKYWYPPLRSTAERQVDEFIDRHRNPTRF
jgi:hypothetical protein